MDNKIILDEFILVTKALNKLGITPIVYGSLGLYFLIGRKIQINDIDLLVEENDFRQWDEIKKIVLDLDYQIDPDHDQEFKGKNCFLSILLVADIKKLIGKNKFNLKKTVLKNAVFYNFSLFEHIKIYQNGLKNIWRCRKKEKDDKEKIQLIKLAIKKK